MNRENNLQIVNFSTLIKYFQELYCFSYKQNIKI